MGEKELTPNQKVMVSDMLIITNEESDIAKCKEKILGNAYGDDNTVKVYEELAKLRLARKRN